MLTDFYPTGAPPKLKVHMALILGPALMHCQVRSCDHWKGENTNTVLKSVRKHLSLKTRMTQKPVNCNALHIN